MMITIINDDNDNVDDNGDDNDHDHNDGRNDHDHNDGSKCQLHKVTLIPLWRLQ